MAGIHNALTRGPWTRAIKAILGDSKSEGGIERFGETLTPVVDMWSRPEFSFLRRERLMGAPFDVTGAAGTVPEVILFNPPASKLVGVVSAFRWVWVTVGAAALDFRLFRGAALPGGFAAVNSGPIDTRDPQLIAAPASGLVAAQAANAVRAGGLPFDTMFEAATTTHRCLEPIAVLAPGTGLTFGASAVGVARFIAAIRWYERTAFGSELLV